MTEIEKLMEYGNTLHAQLAEMKKIENYKQCAEVEVRLDTLRICIEIVEAE